MGRFRKEKVSRVIQQVVSEGIAFKLNDPRVSPLTTVTRVEMTSDLLVARVYVTVPGDSTAESLSLRAIRHASGYLQRMVAKALTMRQCPEVRFEIDETTKDVRRTMELLAENRRNDPSLRSKTDDPDEPLAQEPTVQTQNDDETDKREDKP